MPPTADEVRLRAEVPQGRGRRGRSVTRRGAARTSKCGSTRGLHVLAALMIALAACAPKPDDTADVNVTCTVTPMPARVGPAIVDLKLTEKGRPLTSAKLRVEGHMNHAGMVPSQATVHENGEGLYRAELELTLRGDWILVVDADLADGRTLERTFDVRGVIPK